MDNSHLEGTGLALQLSPDGVELSVVFTPVDNRRRLDPEALRLAIVSCRGFFVHEDALNKLIRRLSVDTLAFTLPVAERRDATLLLHVSEDLMTATITIKQSWGGRNISVDDVERELAEQGVVCGINHEEVEEAVTAGYAFQRVIATGILPQPGQDTQFISLIPQMSSQAPQLSDDDTADYRNFGDIVSVSPGDPLLRRSAPTAGIAGCNLRGLKLPTSDGREIPFADHLTGIVCDLHDRDLLIAAISGYPAIVPNGVMVDPVFKLKRVDLSTGNLHFKGSLEITGDVTEGMEVTATEQVTVGGIVEAAKVKAGGDLVVKGGVIGHGVANKVDGKRETAQISAGGSVTAQFAENAVISAGAEIIIKELVMHSDLTAGGSITVGEQGARMGHIIGGVCRAATLVRAVVIGSRAGVPTVVEVGVDPSLNRKLEITKDAIAEKERLTQELSKTLAYVRANPGSMEAVLVKLKERVFTKYQGELVELTGEKKRLQKRMEINASAKVTVGRDAFIGTQIRIGERMLQIEEDLNSPTFELTEQGIGF
jgi:hypothetical protein